MKNWSHLGVELCQFCPERLEIWRYEWAKIGGFDVFRWPSEVEYQ